MRKTIFTISGFLLTICFFIYADTAYKEKKPDETTIQLNHLAEKYDSLFFQSLFALNEFRSYSILKLDRLIGNYENKWVEPEIIVRGLNIEEKDTLLDNAIYMINDIYTNRREDMILKIKSWCLADIQFDFLQKEYGFSDNVMSDAIRELNIDMNMHELNKSFPSETGADPIHDTKKTYYETLNMISSLDFESQLKYYSKLYYQIALLI